jgi:hypothetical protein
MGTRASSARELGIGAAAAGRAVATVAISNEQHRISKNTV